MPHSPTELDYVSPNWNNPSWWDDFYSGKMEDWKARSYRHRDFSHLIDRLKSYFMIEMRRIYVIFK